MPDTPEWHAARATGIGASEAAAACGLSSYETPLHVYARKVGELAPVEETPAMRLGKKLEPVVISEFIEATGLEVSEAPCPMYRHVDHDFMLATPDAMLEDGDLLEAKTTSWRLAKELGEEGSDYIPESWVMQASQQMAVTGSDLCHVAALIDGRTLRLYQVQRNDVLIERMIAMEAELWQRILDRRPPEPNWGHDRTAQLIRDLYGVAEGKTIVLGDGVAALVTRRRELKERMKELDREQESLGAMILHEMGEAAIACFPGHDFELTRSRVKASTYTVERKSYVMLRERKAQKAKGQ